MRDLNEKIATWCGFYLSTDGINTDWDWWMRPNKTLWGRNAPNFEGSLDYLFEWAVPKIGGYMLFTGEGGIHCMVSGNGLNHEAIAETPALAFCLAVEELIDSEATK